MDQSDAGSAEARVAIRRAAVALVNDAKSDTVESIGAAAGLSVTRVTDHYPDARAVLADVAGRLVDGHRRAVAAAGVTRRRPLTQAVQLGLFAYWADVARRLLHLFSYQLAQHGSRNNKAGSTRPAPTLPPRDG